MDLNKQCCPKEFKSFNNECDFIACFDENGSASEQTKIYKDLIKGNTVDENRRYFTLTCCLFSKKAYLDASLLIDKLKNQYFKKEIEPVVLHDRDIRKKIGPFNFGTIVKYKKFITSLSTLISLCDFKIISISFDLYSYVKQKYIFDPYEVAFDIILDLLMRNTPQNTKVALSFESRGKNEDILLYQHISKIIYQTGTKKFSRSQFQTKFNDVFFNRKISSYTKKAFPGIELADLCSYPFYRYARFKTEGKDFQILKSKLVGYKKEGQERIPGLRKFPKEWEK